MPLFDIFASPRWSPMRMRTKVVPFFIFFQELSKKNWALRPEMTKKKRVKDVEGATFVPLVFSTAGGMGRSSSVTFKRIAALLAEKTGLSYAATINVQLPAVVCIAAVCHYSIAWFTTPCANFSQFSASACLCRAKSATLTIDIFFSFFFSEAVSANTWVYQATWTVM